MPGCAGDSDRVLEIRALSRVSIVPWRDTGSLYPENLPNSVDRDLLGRVESGGGAGWSLLEGFTPYSSAVSSRVPQALRFFGDARKVRGSPSRQQSKARGRIHSQPHRESFRL